MKACERSAPDQDADLITGKGSLSTVATLVERSTGYVAPALLPLGYEPE